MEKNFFGFERKGGFYTSEESSFLYPSVTTVIESAFQKYANIPEGVLQKKAEKGMNIHKQISVLELLPEEMFLETTDHQVKEWIRFKKESKATVLKGKDGVPMMEIFCLSKKYLYAGTADALIEKDGRIFLIDIKTRPFCKLTDTLQLAAYKQAIDETYGIKVDGKMIVSLLENAPYRVTSLDHGVESLEDHFSVFRSALSVFSWKVINGISQK